MLEVSEKEEGVVVIHLPTGSLKPRSGPVLHIMGLKVKSIVSQNLDFA